MKRRLIIFISLILVLLTITAVSANNQTTFKHIQTEIDNADEGSTVTITQDIKDSDNIIVNKSISIEGDGVTLDGKDCIFAIQAQNVTVRGINFVNGWCFEVSNSTTIMSCSFKNNSPADNCLLNLNFANGTRVSIIDCSFESNTLKNAKRSDLGAVITATSADTADNRLTIVNSTFSSNFGYSSGAILLNMDETALSTVIKNTTFTKNTGLTGAISVNNTKARNYLKITNSKFFKNNILSYSNYKKYFKGIIDDDGTFMDETDIFNAISRSYDISVEGSREIFDAKRGPIPVGITDFDISIEDCQFTNKDERINDMEFPEVQSCMLKNNKITLTNSTFTLATIYLSDYQCQMNVKNCLFNRSRIFYYSYDVSDKDDPFDEDDLSVNPGKIELKIIIESSAFIEHGQTVANAVIINSSFYNADVSSQNNSIFINSRFINSSIDVSRDISIDSCSFSNCIRTNGACIRLGSSYEYNFDPYADEMKAESKISVKNSVFKNNYAKYEGGVIYCSSAKVEIYVENSTFINNTARNGGAIYAFAKKGYVKNCIFENNLARNTDNIVYYPPEYIEDIFLIWEYPQYETNNGYLADTLYNKNTKVIGAFYYGNSVFTNLTIEGNFWGVNIQDRDEFISQNIVKSSAPESWINLIAVNGSVRFVLNNGSEVTEIPDYEIALKDGEGNFKRLTIRNGALEVNATDPQIHTSSGIAINKLPATITVTQQSGNYYSKKVIRVVLKDIEGKAIPNRVIYLKFKTNKVVSLKTDSNGVASYTVLMSPGTYNVTATLSDRTYKANITALKNVKVVKLPVKLSVRKLTATYDSGKKMSIKVTDKANGKPIKGLKLTIKDTTSKRTYHATTNAKGIAAFKTSTLKVGMHRIEITTANGNYGLSKAKTSIKITKAQTVISAPKIISKYKLSRYFSIAVKNKATKKAVKNIYVKVKIDNKVIKVKTNSKGIAKINTRLLKVGTHRVLITSANASYLMYAKSAITIRK